MAIVPAQEQFEAILDHVADAVTVQAAGGRLVYANQAALDLLGFETLDSLVATPPDEIRERFRFHNEDGSELPWEKLPGRLALLGEEPDAVVVRWRPAGAASAERWSRIKARPLRDATGAPQMAVNLIEDITEMKLAELAHRFLADSGRVLASSLDYEATLRRVAELAVPQISDWCVVDLATREGFDRVAVAHIDPSKLALVEELTRRYPPDPNADRGVAHVLRTGVSELYPVIPDALLSEVAQDDEHLRLLRSVGMVSAMVVPLRAHDSVLGAITFISAETGRHFGDDDLALADELGRRGGMAIENASLYRQRSEIARVLQSSLLPPVLPVIERLETAAAFRPAGDGAEVGGDFYDVFPVAEDRWFAVVGDVCGKGAPAAATTALARYTIRAAAVRHPAPADILGWLNDAMLRQGSPDQRFCTLAVVRIDLDRPTIRATVASAGHPLPRIVRADGRVESIGHTGTLMGVTPDVELEDRATELSPGDTLVLYTDGLIEARAPHVVWDDADLDAALAAAAGGGGGPHALVDAVTKAALGDPGAPPRDDLAILVLRARPAGG